MRIGIAHDREPGRHAVTHVPRPMPRLCRRVDDVTLVRHEERHITDQELVLPLENEPRFGTCQMEVPLSPGAAGFCVFGSPRMMFTMPTLT